MKVVHSDGIKFLGANPAAIIKKARIRQGFQRSNAKNWNGFAKEPLCLQY